MFEIIDVAGSAAGQFQGLHEGAAVLPGKGPALYITCAGGDGDDVALYTVPEPAALTLLGLGMLAIALRRRLRAIRACP